VSKPLYRSSSSGKSNLLVLNDLLIALGLALLAAFVFWTTPEFAASLPQDAPDYAIPAVNLLERGRLVVSAYGHDFPPAHPPGMPLLLLPSYILFGYFPGNGIYAVLLCSVSTVVLTYIIGVKLGGRLCGCSAALFLIAHHGFWQFSRKIMSEVPSALFGIAVFALLLKIRDR
jgi:4-amino-4-deoxy-L-arabinose transferase-like glycosyltransferase